MFLTNEIPLGKKVYTMNQIYYKPNKNTIQFSCPGRGNFSLHLFLPVLTPANTLHKETVNTRTWQLLPAAKRFLTLLELELDFFCPCLLLKLLPSSSASLLNRKHKYLYFLTFYFSLHNFSLVHSLSRGL